MLEFFLSYSTISKAYRVFNKRTLVIEESMHIVFDESNAFSKEKSIEEYDDVGLEESLNDLKLKDKTRESDKLQFQQKEEENLIKACKHTMVIL